VARSDHQSGEFFAPDEAAPEAVESEETGTLLVQNPMLAPRVEKQAERRPCLVVLQGPYEGRVLRLWPGRTWVIGRSASAQFVLEDEGISRTHMRITQRGDSFIVEDLGSRNGTFVNEQTIAHHSLTPEDVVRVGASTLLRLAFLDPLDEEMHQRLHAAASRDALTKVFNRRHFDERLAAECAGARRHQRPLSLIMVDVDNFKKVNDTLGHPAGDAVLKGVAASLSTAVRREDAVFRYGGEEFAVLLRETHLEGALVLAERLRWAVEHSRHNVEGVSSPLQVTVSVGVGMLAPGMGEEGLIHSADQALYEAKHTGKNRVVHAAPVVAPKQ
jgi:two-component system, cell cycle response regulator